MRYKTAALLILSSLCLSLPAVAAEGNKSSSAAWLQESISELKGNGSKAPKTANLSKKSKPQAVTVTGTGYEVKLRSFRPGRFLPSTQESGGRQTPQMEQPATAKAGAANGEAASLTGRVTSGQSLDYKQIARDGSNPYAEAAFDQLSRVAVKRAKSAVARAMSNGSSLPGNSVLAGQDVSSAGLPAAAGAGADSVFSSPFVQAPSLSAEEEQALNQAVQSSIASGFPGSGMSGTGAGISTPAKGAHFARSGSAGSVSPARFGSWRAAGAQGKNSLASSLSPSGFQSYMPNRGARSTAAKGAKSRTTGKQTAWQKPVTAVQIKAEPVSSPVLKGSPEFVVKPVIASYGRYATRL